MREFYLDRNPIVITLDYLFTVAPHASTERGSYDVPAGRRAFLEYGILSVRRVTVAGSASAVYDFLGYTENGGSERLLDYTWLYGNSIGDREMNKTHYGMLLNAGDNVRINTFDGSTGGTVAHNILVKLTEFDE